MSATQQHMSSLRSIRDELLKHRNSSSAQVGPLLSKTTPVKRPFTGSSSNKDKMERRFSLGSDKIANGLSGSRRSSLGKSQLSLMEEEAPKRVVKVDEVPFKVAVRVRPFVRFRSLVT